jgi:hypothetical protein
MSWEERLEEATRMYAEATASPDPDMAQWILDQVEAAGLLGLSGVAAEAAVPSDVGDIYLMAALLDLPACSHIRPGDLFQTTYLHLGLERLECERCMVTVSRKLRKTPLRARSGYCDHCGFCGARDAGLGHLPHLTMNYGNFVIEGAACPKCFYIVTGDDVGADDEHT